MCNSGNTGGRVTLVGVLFVTVSPRCAARGPRDSPQGYYARCNPVGGALKQLLLCFGIHSLGILRDVNLLYCIVESQVFIPLGTLICSVVLWEFSSLCRLVNNLFLYAEELVTSAFAKGIVAVVLEVVCGDSGLIGRRKLNLLLNIKIVISVDVRQTCFSATARPYLPGFLPL